MNRQHPSHPANDRDPYEPRPAPAPNPRKNLPVHVSTLDYERQQAKPQSSGLPTAVQFVLGMLSPFVFGSVASMILALIPFMPSVIGLAMIPAFIVLVMIIRRKTGWTGFVPGVLTAVFVLPIALFVLCGLIVGAVVTLGG